jgi:hypothetical protein
VLSNNEFLEIFYFGIKFIKFLIQSVGLVLVLDWDECGVIERFSGSSGF